jgi:hypothetical protein
MTVYSCDVTIAEAGGWATTVIEGQGSIEGGETFADFASDL